MIKSASALFYLIKRKHYITFQIPYDKLKDYFDIIKKKFYNMRGGNGIL